MAARLTGQKPFKLTWLFEAMFLDGSVLRQTSDDVSGIDPIRSAYYDVLQRLDELEKFTLWEVKGVILHHSVSVDLTDGHFEVDGFPFEAAPVSANIIPAGGRYQLLYFRDHQQDTVVTFKEGTRTDEMAGHRMAYRLGWEYFSPDGQKYIQTIVVK